MSAFLRGVKQKMITVKETHRHTALFLSHDFLLSPRKNTVMGLHPKTKIMKGMCWQKLRGLQDAGFLYISLKRSLPPIFDIYLQFLPTHFFHNLRQTNIVTSGDFVGN